MALDAGQLRALVTDTLGRLGESGRFAAHPAVNLVLGTMAVESELRFIRQIPNAGGQAGPARGLAQCEPATALDIWDNYLKARMARFDSAWQRATGLTLPESFTPHWLPAEEPERGAQQRDHIGYLLMGNLHLAICLCRMHYWRLPDVLPTTLDGAAQFWKLLYNTPLGAGTPEKFIAAYTR